MPTNNPTPLTTSPSTPANGAGPCPWQNVWLFGPIYCAGWGVGSNLPTSGGVSSGLGALFATTLIALVELPFKLLGINSPADFLWRAFFILLGVFLLMFGLVVISGEAEKDVGQKVESAPGAQQAEQGAMMAA